jgi:APA family basic amino acid/polyamine antiporter
LLGPFAATSLVVASMVGTGVFVTSGYLAQTLGDPRWALALWLVGGLLALSGATVYAELGAMMPRAGGEYVYLSQAFHPSVGFLSGWVSLWVGFSAPIAAAATACAEYARVVLPLPSTRITASLLIALLSVLHMTSRVWGARAQTVMTSLKVGAVLAFVLAVLSMGSGSSAHFSSARSAPSLATLGTGLVYVAFAYSGWNAAAYIAGELERPERTLPRALLFGTAFVTLLYLLLNVALFYALPASDVESPELMTTLAASAAFGSDVGGWVAGAIALLLLSSISAMVMTGPRVYAAMAEDGLFFRSLERTNRGGAPARSVALQWGLATLLAITTSFEALITYVGFTLSAFSALTVLGAMVLRRRMPNAERPYRALAWPLSPLAFIALATWMVASSIAERPSIALAGALTLLVGLAVYGLWNRTGASPNQRALPRLTQDRRTASARRRRRRWPPKMPRPPLAPHPRA